MRPHPRPAKIPAPNLQSAVINFFDQIPHHRQPDAVTRDAGIGALTAMKQQRRLFRRNAGAVVLNFHHQFRASTVIGGIGAHYDPPSAPFAGVVG